MTPATDPDASATFERLTSLDGGTPTLIEGLPGHGLVAAIAVGQIREQLGLEHHGNIRSSAFPPVATFADGLVQDLVRVYAGTEPDVLTLQSDLALPPSSWVPLAECVIEQCAEEFDRAIFLTGVPAESESRLGDVAGVGTTPAMRDELDAAGVDLASDPGLVGGVTGALVERCYHEGVPAMVLVVRAHPFLPDPGAAQHVIEEALEPLVEFDIDTTELREQADEISARMQQLSEQYEQMERERQGVADQSRGPSMFQ
ncbi:PAC2 family protein [Salinirubellus salinus]|uniref:PAC2 family protein n=1 Tax=Salinirubellus salinus TaxID=1364945 RepID=A0A9E7UB01_9EURY|nr:PAC2 family protein [Salinirubellus salinus]UWM54572.1 PAC2 family protein [Salinirubellus salinus]